MRSSGQMWPRRHAADTKRAAVFCRPLLIEAVLSESQLFLPAEQTMSQRVMGHGSWVKWVDK